MSNVVVKVNTEGEDYPVLHISEIGNPEPGQGYAIPAELLDNLGQAYTAVGEAELAIMRHIAARYPSAHDVREWLKAERERNDDE